MARAWQLLLVRTHPPIPTLFLCPLQAADFEEWFEADGCAGQALAGVGQIGPFLTLQNGSKLVPTQVRVRVWLLAATGQ